MPFRRPDGSLAGVAGMDIKIAHALVESESTSRWSQKMSSFIVGEETNSRSKKGKIWVLSSQEKTAPPDSKSGGEIFSQNPEIEEMFHRIKNKKSGYLDMPYKGKDSLWAYAAMIANQYFVIVVPKSVIMTLPEEVGQMFVEYSKHQTAIWRLLRFHNYRPRPACCGRWGCVGTRSRIGPANGDSQGSDYDTRLHARTGSQHH
jgi:hypothetical protein